jgi:3-dehydro-4-phosphotetronate decarboxylase
VSESARDPDGASSDAASAEAARTIVDAGARLADRGLAHGATGNLSIRQPDGTILVTPTGARLGRLETARLSRLRPDGSVTAGDRPSKEWPLHAAMYEARPDIGAIVHLHSRHAAAVACLDDLDASDALPTYTAYQAMRVGRLRLVAFFPPGDRRLADGVGAAAGDARSLLLANHGLVAGGTDLDAAVESAEEIEETCALHLLLSGHRIALVPPDDVEVLRSGNVAGGSSVSRSSGGPRRRR